MYAATRANDEEWYGLHDAGSTFAFGDASGSKRMTTEHDIICDEGRRRPKSGYFGESPPNQAPSRLGKAVSHLGCHSDTALDLEIPPSKSASCRTKAHEHNFTSKEDLIVCLAHDDQSRAPRSTRQAQISSVPGRDEESNW
ncbi:hypothetical protein SISNIDRAFT_470432 [Sistotremastrum niveocremeum HHB9708]|uniref:Uncharacterized protein n=1 Tax=Sistotremastrum niveocremeum HHB9708 TaxID=1314777 RepID=A0A164NWM4_9AGAM|nr:hypothetical protein SISNIDRAFT_470432 [Sistotremastrum niveocremeum HHB9708]